MRVFAISDIHLDYEVNLNWLLNLSKTEYTEDILILAGDISDDLTLLEKAFRELKSRFKEVMYVPGNHDLWVRRRVGNIDSLEKLRLVRLLACDAGVRTEPMGFDGLSIVPLYGWYDYSFGTPSDRMLAAWNDFSLCKWPKAINERAITRHFLELNEAFFNVKAETLITFSHFLPRIDIMPPYIPEDKRELYPLLGTALLDQQVRKLGAKIHIYGHSHVNRQVEIDGITYINNAFGYPYETQITAKRLRCVYEK